MPAARWPVTVQKNWYSPGWKSAVTFETPPFLTISPASLTPLPSTAMLWSTEDSLGESISSWPAWASALAYVFANAEAQAGQLEIDSPNESSVDHNIAVEGNGVNEAGEVVSNGGVSKVSADLKPGEYQFFCTVTGHRQAGMEGKLTVR